MKRDKTADKITRYLEDERLTEAQRATASEFHEHMESTGRMLNTRVEYVRVVVAFADVLQDRPFNSATRKDFSKYMGTLKKKSPVTKQNYYAILMVFYKWLGEHEGDAEKYTKLLKPERYKPPVGENHIIAAEDLPNEEEVLRIIKFAGNPRDRCMIAMSFDLGTRPSELLSLDIKNVNFDEYGATVTITQSKSMRRTLRLISSLPYLREWYEDHPYNDKPDAPLFIGMSNSQFGGRIEAQTLRFVVQQAAKRAGITKRIYTYQLRHSSVTRNAAVLSEQQLKAFHGWRPASRMLNVYSHLTTEDVNKARLAQAGMIEVEQNPVRVELQTCPRCGAENPATHEYCSKCAAPLDETRYRELMSREEELTALREEIESLKEHFQWMREHSAEAARYEQIAHDVREEFGDKPTRERSRAHAKKITGHEKK